MSIKKVTGGACFVEAIQFQVFDSTSSCNRHSNKKSALLQSRLADYNVLMMIT